MSNAGLATVFSAVGNLLDANDDAQTFKTEGTADLVLVNFELYHNWDAVLQEDANTALADSVLPDNQSQVAVDQAKRQTDTTQSEKENGMMETLVETRKQELELVGNNLLQVTAIIDPMKQMLAFFTGIIGQPIQSRG
jgi:hypothetical protein